jgi:hypothetical protein
VFEGLDHGHIAVNGASLQVKIIRAGAMPDFFLHGVRHLAETKMAELKIPAHLRDMVLDHAPSRGSGAAYDHHEYKDEMRAALETWAQHIERIVTPQGAVRVR